MDPATSNTNVFPSRLAPVVGGGIVDGGDDPAGFNIYNNSQIAGFYGITQPGVFSWQLVAFNAVNALVPAVGLVLNALLVLVTVGDKNLNGSCNHMLAFGAVCDFTYHASFFIPLAISLSGINFIRLELCYWVQAVSVFGVFSSVWVVLFVGLDRLLSVIFPLWHRTVNRLAYYSVVGLVGGGYSLYVLVLAFQVALKYPHWPAMCRINDLFTLDGLDQWTLRNGLVINGVSFLMYALVWAVIHKIHKSKIQQQPRGAVAVARTPKQRAPTTTVPTVPSSHHGGGSDTRIFRALLAIMVLVVGTYWGTCVFGLATASLTTPFFQNYASPTIGNLLAQCAATCNTPLLLVFSNDYRRAFHAVLGRYTVTRPLLRRLVPKPHGFVSHVTVIDMATPTRGGPPATAGVAATAAGFRSQQQQQQLGATTSFVRGPKPSGGGFGIDAAAAPRRGTASEGRKSTAAAGGRGGGGTSESGGTIIDYPDNSIKSTR